MITIVTNARNGPVSRVRSVAEDDELIFTSSEGIIIRIPAKDISIQGRNTQGVRIMNIKSGDKVAGVARIKNGKAEKELEMTALAREKGEAEQKTESSEDEAETLEDIQDIGDLEDTIEDLEYAEESEKIEEAQDEIEKEFDEAETEEDEKEENEEEE